MLFFRAHRYKKLKSKRALVISLLILISLVSAREHREKSTFEIYGDVFQLMPLYAGVYSIYKKDYAGLKHLCFSTLSTIAITLSFKFSFVRLSRANADLAQISQRPDSRSYDGFPSGHTSAAFVGAGYLAGRYGRNVGAPAMIAASLVGLSRIYALRHTPTQVLSGALLGFGLGYFLNERLKYQSDSNSKVSLDANLSANYGRIVLSYRF